ncbi:mechanosensitive ion channel family protein [Methanonatronarchaeum sp. AMET6-2]|uniref:mechanosensitive ion channel family protein n=1 Tax=Methanonatronarchaeum sp. AMET6-2 TaxID=2933293 RepID=UPI0011FFAF7C|nr:mechanosensitive ion channel family protein [Methanonatronarchaeum sp. AMET6-2]RZN61288.1 MAG: mechanosensitive ion channel family protein [Methanonatronarchaeia archaeon]UOY09709.1 mechanosensitive ion channel family protein [Methanonatronarchaeum sp. AMET6-2]
MVEPLPVLEPFLGGYAGIVTQAIYFVVSFLVIYLVGKAVVVPIIDRVMSKRGLETHARKPIKKVLNFAVLFAALALAFGFAGLGNILLALAGIAAAATLAIGFALQDVIKNFVSGIFIFIEKPFKIGDWIIWGGGSGIVEDISMRVTMLRTFDNELVTVPNSVLTDTELTNPVAKDKLRIKCPFGISYDDDINKATEIILEEAEKHDGIMGEPEPIVRLTELEDSYVGLQCNVWVEEPSRRTFAEVKSSYTKTVKERFDEEDITIPFPQRELSGKIQT